MDTRSKIVEARAVPREPAPTLVIGYFDPLYAGTVQRIASLGSSAQTVVVAVADPPQPLLPWRARAELAASLASVDFVISAADAGEISPAQIIDDRAAHEESRDSLVRLVLSKHA